MFDISDLDPWLTPRQAQAWILFRDPAKVMRASVKEKESKRAYVVLNENLSASHLQHEGANSLLSAGPNVPYESGVSDVHLEISKVWEEVDKNGPRIHSSEYDGEVVSRLPSHVDNATNDLICALKSGKIKARVFQNYGPHLDLEPDYWHRRTFLEEKIGDKHLVVATDGQHRGSHVVVDAESDFGICRDDLVREFPQDDADQQPCDFSEVNVAGVAIASPMQSGQIALDRMSTGLPGRPTKGIHLLQMEMACRIAEHREKENMSQEATALRRWFTETHPTSDPMTEKTIRNQLGHDFRRLRQERDGIKVPK